MSIKGKIFNYLSKAQKSELCYYVTKFVKKNFELNEEKIINLFIEEEIYYLEINASRHSWIKDFINEEIFHKELNLFVKEIKKKYEHQDKYKEYAEKQKIYQKHQRKLIKDKKMSKEQPTKAQISYYKALCKKYSINENILNLEEASKLDLKNALDTLLSEQEVILKKSIIEKLNDLKKI